MKKIITILIALTTLFSGYAVDKIITFKPITVPLPVNKEVIVKFPYAVNQTELLSGEHAGKFSQFLTPDGALHLKATEPFGKARLVAEMVSGKLVLLDIQASIGAVNHEVIKLIDPKTLKKPAAKKAPVVQKPEVNPNKPDFLRNGGVMTKTSAAAPNTGIGYNTMTQFGFRHFVGPSRLIGNEIKAKKVKVSRKGLNTFVRFSGNRLALNPLRQWKVADKYLTVLLVKNHSALPVQFDPRALRGRIQFSAALHPVIQGAGSMHDQTLWAVITASPFNQAIAR